MRFNMIEKVGNVKIFGDGSTGGKGAGLIRINECHIPKVQKLRTRILTTSFYDQYLERGGSFGTEELDPIQGILKELSDIPISVRSSATNESNVSSSGEVSVRAGENTSFMLPNNHADFKKRFQQLTQAIYFIYRDFIAKQSPDSQEKMGIVINPIPGMASDTQAGQVYFPLVSGVANSYFPYALKAQNHDEGYARIAFGHGYAVVTDDFPVISMATIRHPLPIRLLGEGQRHFYAIDMTKNEDLLGDEMETMRRLHIRFADMVNIESLGRRQNSVTLESLIEADYLGFKSILLEIMDIIASKISSHFQIEFIFNIDFKDKNQKIGTFHVVQLTPLPELKFDRIQLPEDYTHSYLSIENFQGHGIRRGITHAVVVSPFIYTKSMQGTVRNRLSEVNRLMRDTRETYIIIVPGRLGSTNRDWGIFVEYRDIDGATAVFEYGVDISGRPEPLPESESLTGGIYGSHFLYMIQGGFNDERKRLETRMYGTQGTHFLTNLMGNNVIYGYISPTEDTIDPWFFSPTDNNDALYVLTFPKPVGIFADTHSRQCLIIPDE